jgi:Rrf2 family iron-sulfur cluster assembly transcriptional regulator
LIFMIGYGKTSQNAIAAMSYLAARYDGGQTRVSSLEIAEARHLPKPLVAKILTILSQAGYVQGAPGPGGGYALAFPPEEISLQDVVGCFEKAGAPIMCPFGPDWCGNENPCPLHDEIAGVGETLEGFLQGNHFGIFRAHEQRAEVRGS